MTSFPHRAYIGKHGKYGTAKQAIDNDIVWRMRLVCWITKATDTNS